ncbi:MAG: CPBP family intramembrane glutamic endopeptidase [Armatimonadota bacterium]
MSPVPVQLPLLIIVLAVLALAVPLGVRRLRLTPVQAGWRWGGIGTVFQGIGWGVLLAAGMLTWLRYLIGTGNYLPISVTPTPLDWVLLVIAVPIVEELFFRGVVFAGLQRTWRPFWAVALSATICTLAHPYDSWLALIFLAGVGYALAFRFSRSVVPPIIAHALVSTALLIGMAYPLPLYRLPPLPLLIVAIGALLVIVLSSTYCPEGARAASHGWSAAEPVVPGATDPVNPEGVPANEPTHISSLPPFQG